MKSKIIKIQQDPKSKDGFIDIQEFKDLFDISKIDSYKLTSVENKNLILEFFDKDGNKILPKK